MSYLDIDTILCDEERLPCHFLLEASDLGFLDSTIESPDLPEGSRVELPMWMALVLSDKQMASLELPKHFERKMRDEILAGAANINLKEYSFYFFEVGSRLATQLDSRDLKEIMFKAFSGERYRELMVHSLTSWNEDVGDFAQNLTAMEHKLFLEGMKTSKDLHKWRLRQTSLLQKAFLLGRSSTHDVYSSGSSGIKMISNKRKL